MNAALIVLVGLAHLGDVGPLAYQGELSTLLRSPARVAIAPDDTILVTDPFRNEVIRFNPDTTVAGGWSVPDGPIGIAVHPDGRFFVSLRDLPKVAIFDASYNPAGFLGVGLVTFSKPTDIDIHSVTGRIYVVDSGADHVVHFESDGTAPVTIGMRGELPGEFAYPSAIAVDETFGQIVVSDQDNFRVQTFSTAGVFASRFGYRLKYAVGGGQEGWLPRPQGVEVDASGNVYVVDMLMGTVHLFDRYGAELGKLAGYGSDAADLRNPCGIALSNDGSLLYVASSDVVKIYATPSLGALAAVRDSSSIESPNPPGTNRSEYDAAIRQGLELPVDWMHGRRIKTDANRRTTVRGTVRPRDAAREEILLSDYEGPHMAGTSIVCGRCHGITGQPGTHPGTTEGQQALCLSCHSAGGQAMTKPMFERDNPANHSVGGYGRSHAWGVPAVNGSVDSVGPAPDGIMELYLDGGDIKCSTCHDQHTDDVDSPYLRSRNNSDAMCKQCHEPRDVGPGEGGSHPVGFAYPAGAGEFPASDPSPLVLDGVNIECMTCHGVHNADSGGANDGEGDAKLLRMTNDAALCQTCHADHIGHTPGGSWLPTCVECHGIHDPGNPNLSLVASTVYNETLGLSKPVVLTAREGANSYDDGDPAVNDGICQVCHTITNYHRHDGSAPSHNDGANCLECHPHDAGFMPTGGDCTSCHSSPQDNGDGIPVGGRRAVVAEFPTVGEGVNAHSHFGAELDNDACTVCHDQTTHQDGNVDLIDPDDGSLFTFVKPWSLTYDSGDPDLSDFCAACHDGDGATRLGEAAMDPFGNGNTPPDVAAKFQGTLQWNEWYGDGCFGAEGTNRHVNSHHDVLDADQAWSGARIECLSCHGAHTSGESQKMVDPFDTLSAWTGSSNGFCLECHYGGSGPDDPGFPPGVVGPTVPLRGIDSCDYQEQWWYVDYSWTHSAHGPDSKRGWEGYSGAESVDMDCLACHDSHGSYTPSNTLGNPYMIRDTVDGTGFIDDGTRTGGFYGPPFDTTGVQRDVVVSISGINVDWGSNASLCSACHAGWLSAYDWHSYCDGCQTCHGHGMAFGEYDFVGARDDTPCPPPAIWTDGVTKPLRPRENELRVAPTPDGKQLRSLHLYDTGR